MINLGFLTEGKLAAIFIKPSLGVPNWPVIYFINSVVSHVTSKIISFVITYLLEDKQELSLGMLIRLQRIHNF
jgi:hypothetical protein